MKTIESRVMLPEWCLLNSLRYALGRHTYVVGETIALLEQKWPHLSNYTRSLVHREVTEHLETQRSVGRLNFTYPDLKAWQDFLRVVGDDKWTGVPDE